MVAQVAITGSGSTSVSPAQSSASAGSSFTDLLQSMVKPASAHSSCATSSSSDCSPSKPVQPIRSDVSADRSVDQKQKVSETSADKQEASKPAKAAPRTEQASSDKDSEPAVKSSNASSASDAASDVPPSSEEHKDDVDPLLAGMTLLSVIPASVQPPVTPADAATPDASTGDAVSVAPSAEQAPADAVTRPATGTPATAVTPAAVEAVPADAAESEPAAVNGADDFSDELSAAAGKPELAGKDEKDTAAAEPVEKKLATTAQAAAPEKLAHPGIPVTEPATDAPAAVDVAKAAQVQAVTNSANPDAVATDTKTVARAAEKTESVGGVETTGDRSKERASFRQADSESSTKQGGRDNTRFSAVSLDTNTVAATHGSKGNESAPQQDVPLQVVTAASHFGKANDARNSELQASSSLHTAAPAASSTPHTPDTSWMSSVRLMERISQSEMRVGIQSELGDIAVRTAMNRHELSAEISVQHAGLRDAIAAEIPGLQSRLSAQQIPMTNVSVTADAGGGANSFQQSAQDGRPASHYSAAANSNDSSVAEHESAVPVEVLGRSAGLDIRI